MGRVRTKTVKRAAKVLLERHYQKLTTDFHINKRILSEVAKVPTKRLRNKIAGFATHLVKRIQKGPVKGISLKVQQEERERRLDWVPKESQIKLEKVAIDAETLNMIKSRYGEQIATKLSENLEVKATDSQKKDFKPRRKGDKGGERGEKKERAPRQKQEGAQGQESKPREPREPRQQKQPRQPRQQKEGGKDQKDAPKREARKRGNREGQQ